MAVSTYKEESIAIEDYFNTQWPGVAPGVPIAWPNVVFNPATVDEFVRFQAQPIEAEKIGSGSSADLYRYPGSLEVKVFVKKNKGANRATVLGDAVCDLFRGLRLAEDIIFRAPVISVVGQVAGWYQVIVSCNYQRDSFLARA